MRLAASASLAGGALGTVAIMASGPAPLAVLGGALVGIGAEIPFAPAFTGAALARLDAPAASVEAVNAGANLIVLAGTPLVGLTFSAGGEGRIGFAAIAILWLVALALVPSARALGASPRATRRSPLEPFGGIRSS